MLRLKKNIGKEIQECLSKMASEKEIEEEKQKIKVGIYRAFRILGYSGVAKDIRQSNNSSELKKHIDFALNSIMKSGEGAEYRYNTSGKLVPNENRAKYIMLQAKTY